MSSEARSEAPLGHADAIRGLWRAAAAGRLAHALLFVGPAGIGKFLAARWLAAGLFCERGPGEPCGRCAAEKRVAAGTHPDLFVLDVAAEGEELISIGRIAPREGERERSVGEFLSLKPMEAGWRVVLVRDAQRMNAAAQNAFLKTLEEPGARALLVLETAWPGRLLDTLKSRCVTLALAPLAAHELARLLAARGLAGERAERLARWAHGSPGRALELAARGAETTRALLVERLAGRLGAQECADGLWALEADFGAGTARAQERERARAALELWIELLETLLRLAAGIAPEELAHGDLASSCACPSTRVLERALATALVARQDVERNLPPQPVVEAALAAWPAPARTGGAQLTSGARPIPGART